MWRMGANSALMPAPPSMSRQSRATSSAMRQLFHLASETCAGCMVPASFMRPSCRASSCAVVMRRDMSARRAWIIWFCASGRPNSVRVAV